MGRTTKHTVDEWTDTFSIDIYDWDARDFYGSKLVTFDEFCEGLGECRYAFLTHEGLRKFSQYVG